MNIETIRESCLKKNGVTEGFPFDEDTLVFKVMGKIFLLASLEKFPLQINLKCEPEMAVELREKYDAVLPGYHMNKKHLKTVIIDNSIHAKEVLKLINHYSIIRVLTVLKLSEFFLLGKCFS
jgi:predicted DNA-binding protein (MmcQ/YjbR family)